MNTAYLLLGSNEGNRLQWLEQCLQQLENFGTVTKRSQIYQTAAWGLEEQPDFLNMAVEVQTTLSSKGLLKGIQQIETNLGRQRTLKWGQRTLDIDILFYNNEIIDLPDLKVPHPFLQERRFALVPLNDIAPAFMHPVLKKTVGELLNECKDELEVRRFS